MGQVASDAAGLTYQLMSASLRKRPKCRCREMTRCAKAQTRCAPARCASWGAERPVAGREDANSRWRAPHPEMRLSSTSILRTRLSTPLLLSPRLATGPSAPAPRSGLERSDFVPWPIASFRDNGTWRLRSEADINW